MVFCKLLIMSNFCTILNSYSKNITQYFCKAVIGGRSMDQEMERVVMKLIMNGGDARSFSLKAIQSAEKGDINEAIELLEQSNVSLNKAHEAQANLIREEIRGLEIPLSLMVIHAQDHVMNAMTVRDLAQHIIKAQEDILELKILSQGRI